MKFTQIPYDTFETIQLNAGILLDGFTIGTGAIGNILGATSGGISFSATQATIDFADGIDNAPKKMMEFQRHDSWDAKMSGTFATVSADLAKTLVAAADISGVTYVATTDTAVKPGKKYYTRTGTSPNFVYMLVTNPVTADIATYYVKAKSAIGIIPRANLLTTDFSDIWWVGDYSDLNGSTNGGFCAIHLKNALSTGGFKIQSGDKAKGQFGFEFTGHYSNENPETVPFEIYIKGGSPEPTT